MAQKRKSSNQQHSVERGKGLFRTLIAGEGHTLTDAFDNLQHAACVNRIWRHPHRQLLGARITLAPEEGDGYWDFTQIGHDLYIVVGNFTFKDPRLEFVPGDGLVQFFFCLSGDLTMAVSRTEPLHINRPSLLIYSQPKGVDFNEWTAPSAHERWVVITVRPQFLADSFLGSSADAPRQLQALLGGTSRALEYFQLPLNAQMFELATKLVNNSYSGVLGHVYAEAVAVQLLCTAIASFDSLASIPTEHYSEREVRCFYSARNILMQQLTPVPKIRQIARSVGMSETNLKRGFKLVFGETIFEFSVRCRMQHALTLLRDHRTPIARVAEAVGYRHQTSFATAFREHFGLRPKDVRHTQRP
jgi:AraC-like DNA-binding protein